MGTVIRPEISKNNKYWINKHRHYELKHFCLQYPVWKKESSDVYNSSMYRSMSQYSSSSNSPSDPTYMLVMTKLSYEENINLIERIAKQTDKYLSKYILKAVTEGLSYTYLKTRLEIPCSRDTYYDRYRRFFWLLSQARS